MTLGLEGWPSARRGDFRVVYRIDEAERRVEVVAIDHRADVYRVAAAGPIARAARGCAAAAQADDSWVELVGRSTRIPHGCGHAQRVLIKVGDSGAPGQIRTGDARLRSPALYPLSYEGGEC